MKLFFLGLVILLGGYAVYGRLVERILAPDDRDTPAVKLSDGVDYVLLDKAGEVIIPCGAFNDAPVPRFQIPHPVFRLAGFAVYSAGAGLQLPVAASAGDVSRGRHIGTGKPGHALQKAFAQGTAGRIATIEQDVAAGVQ